MVVEELVGVDDGEDVDNNINVEGGTSAAGGCCEAADDEVGDVGMPPLLPMPMLTTEAVPMLPEEVVLVRECSEGRDLMRGERKESSPSESWKLVKDSLNGKRGV